MLKTRLEKFYEKVLCEDFVLLYNLKNLYTLPVFEKAILNTTSKHFVSEKEALLQQFSAFFLQTGKLPINTRAHNSIALFNIRQGNILGLKTTLRRQSLYNYLDKALIFVIPKSISTTSLQKPLENQSLLFLSEKGMSPLINIKHLTKKNKPLNEEKSCYNQFSTPEQEFASQLKKKIDFVISENKVTRFPEVSSLLLFFNSTTGFSLDCLFSRYGQKSLSKLKSSPKVTSKVKSAKKKRDIGCNKKNLFISAFGYPLFL